MMKEQKNEKVVPSRKPTIKDVKLEAVYIDMEEFSTHTVSSDDDMAITTDEEPLVKS